eukprot:TRINITY_DN15777_c0_g1_i1.p3 TRINITY_DN15777_c0_g1~~TRINITY_DN15777_c0_g1_i1.p3  ORF type:complete len:168 (+),score=50.07 TRINITY_DN15777_c0_g1_i1:1967-2470(+)
MSSLQEYPELKNLTLVELNGLLESDVAFDDFFANLKVVQDRKVFNTELQEGNERTARENLELEQQIAALKSEIAELTAVHESQKAELESKLKEKAALAQKYSPAVVAARLRDATQATEDESEKIAETFHQGDMDLKTFLKQYSDLREKYHLQKLRSEYFAQKFLPSG